MQRNSGDLRLPESRIESMQVSRSYLEVLGKSKKKQRRAARNNAGPWTKQAPRLEGSSNDSRKRGPPSAGGGPLAE